MRSNSWFSQANASVYEGHEKNIVPESPPDCKNNNGGYNDFQVVLEKSEKILSR